MTKSASAELTAQMLNARLYLKKTHTHTKCVVFSFLVSCFVGDQSCTRCFIPSHMVCFENDKKTNDSPAAANTSDDMRSDDKLGFISNIGVCVVQPW